MRHARNNKDKKPEIAFRAYLPRRRKPPDLVLLSSSLCPAAIPSLITAY